MIVGRQNSAYGPSIVLRAVAVSLFVACAVLVQSCSDSLKPGYFWTKHEPASIIEESSDFGPYGGHVFVHWKSEEAGTFLQDDMVALASDQGWTLVDAHEVPEAVVRKWVRRDGKPFFPLGHDGLHMDVAGAPAFVPVDSFSLRMESDIVLLEFETTMILVMPGTGEVTETNGFILLSPDGSEMSVYFLWGE